jgi:HD-like signal output (HDOD) protein
MPAQLDGPDGAGGESASSDESERLEKEQSQEAKIRALLVDGIPTLPAYVFELSALLSTIPVDLRRVCGVIQTDPSLTAQVIRLCNSAQLGLRERVSNIEHAVILLGTERLRTMVLNCSLVECVGSCFSPTELQSFWQHCLLTATLSARSALCLRYPEVEQAYLAGLLHDVGVLPLLILALRSTEPKVTPGAILWGESIESEQKQFGVDHCSVGKCIGLSWNFSPELIDVLEHHHRPQEARQNVVLVEIVRAADLVCQMHGVRVGGEPPRITLGDQNKYKHLLDSCAPSLTDEERTKWAKTLEVELPNIIQLLEMRVSTGRGGAVLPWPGIWG